MAFNLGDALKAVSNSGTGREQIEYIWLHLLEEDPNNFYQLSGIEELAANIELCGLQQPIRVRPIPGNSERYMIVSGHRRRKAIEVLAQDDPDRWEKIPCIVESDAVSPTLQQLRLIFANANTRTMTAVEISKQAEQVRELLYKLKEEEGYEFPGRMRDHVAEVVGVSKSKLARLKVIRDDLAAAWRPEWENGTLPENTAYELAKMPLQHQVILWEEKLRIEANPSADDVKTFAGRAAKIANLTCGETISGCENAESKIRKAAASERCGWFYCDSKCCKDCPELDRCKRACPKLKDLIASRKADAKATAAAAKEAQAAKDKPAVDQISALWQRFGLARGMAGKSIEECKSAMDMHFFPFGEEKTMKLECGEAKITADTKLPYSYACSLTEIKKLIALADLLDCSLDWLLCRRDADPVDAVPESDTAGSPEYIPGAWYSADVEPPVGAQLILMDSDGFVDTGKYMGCGEYTMDYGDPVALWTFVPDKNNVISSPISEPGTMWRSGNPAAYGTYAAYVKVEGAPRAMLRELLWTGDEWLMHGAAIHHTASVVCWAEPPEG